MWLVSLVLVQQDSHWYNQQPDNKQQSPVLQLIPTQTTCEGTISGEYMGSLPLIKLTSFDSQGQHSSIYVFLSVFVFELTRVDTYT